MNPIARCFIFFFLSNLVFFMNLAESKCQESFNCGYLGSLKFPLSDQPGCGLFLVNCTAIPLIQFRPGGLWYSIIQKISANKFKVADGSLNLYMGNRNCFAFRNTSILDSPLSSFSISPNLTIFRCSNFLHPDDREKIKYYFKNYRNYTLCDGYTLYYRDQDNDVPIDIVEKCSVVQMPVKHALESGDLFEQLSPEFELEWNISSDCLSCHSRGRKCVASNDQIHCEGKWTFKKKIFLTGGVSFVALIIFTSILLFLLIRRKYTLFKLLSLQAKPESQKGIELFLKNHGNLAQKRFKYSDLKKMTNSFRENLGKGGYGSVYKGRLPDGRLVAVKILNEPKENGEDFINEVASISRTSHINIVTLIGFCYEGSERALVYDFMPNGSLDKFMQNSADWQKLFEIIVGIARGLEYLHRGCNTRILHFDIKPHNILLDKDFNPKISDFGLAKLCPNRSSIVSMLVARGTIGYIAPEVFCRNFGEVSYKSDVYSYGMMILEIAGGRKNIDHEEVDHSSDIYFPQYIYKQLEMDDKNGVLEGIMNEDESQYVKRKMIIVGLWCIQTDPKQWRL
ncbi:Serine/threonine protein kinase [Handroanthus impetiginosus]|uniref:Serine/threonine protein kinase n=1 Tax=Handroanthus impetiginosus TaxID=429701 RepID=A0A2G9I8L3_9LAMI|nr:Serine/threonine protein kinase [Handroanthus impetiginosus]